jgi:hypothetical protein
MLVLLLAAAASVQAQPVLTFPANAPMPGNSCTLHFSPYVDPGAPGANQSWDLSTLASDSTVLIQHVAPTSTDNGASFPGATVAETGTGANMYFRSASDGIYFVGSDADGLVIFNSDQGKYLPFPCTYQSTWTDQSEAQYSSEDFESHRHTMITGTVDGYGSVAMPSGTATDVLRVHWHEETTDSTDFFTILSVNDSYIFYSASRSYPLAQLITASVSFPGATNTVQYARWVDDITTGIPTVDNSAGKPELYPVPTSGILNFNLPTTMSGRPLITITDGQGRPVRALRPTQLSDRGGHMDLSGLAPGIYHFSAIDEQGQRSERDFVIQ